MKSRLPLGRTQNYDIHMHTWYCDGHDAPGNMVIAAFKEGLDAVGISGHSFTPHDTSYCMSREGTEEYINEILRLRRDFEGRIEVLLGVERDYYADIDNASFDYVIGSLHYLFCGDDWTDVDDTPYKQRAFATAHFGGDMLSLAELYYETVGGIVGVTDCDIIGHFDLITKFNERFRMDDEGAIVDTREQYTQKSDLQVLFDTQHPRYINAWKRAIDRIFEETAGAFAGGKRNRLFDSGDKPVFEINTGAISRGYRTGPYPAPDQVEYIRSKGGYFVLTSDSHSEKNLCYNFDDYRYML